MNVYQQFGTSTVLENEGVWVTISEEGAQLRIARVNNPAYKALHTKLWRPHRAEIRAGTVTDKVAEAITIKLLSETVLLDWRGINGQDGKALAYSTEAAAKLLKDLKDFRDRVVQLGQDMTLFQELEEEEQTGN